MHLYFSGMQIVFFSYAKWFMWHGNLFFGIAKFAKLGMQNPFSGLQFAFFACNITFQTCGNDPPQKNLCLIQ
jgi:hypothetical protein